MKNFALIGAAGYIAPRHLRAIKETGNNLLCALDPQDSVGILDSYFPQAHFFTQLERFDRHIAKLQSQGTPLDYITITSPNHLHDSHIRFALKNGAHAICEKPLVLNPWNLDTLETLQSQTQKQIYTILQLRHHPSIIALKERIQKELATHPHKHYNLTLTYITARGRWYFASWKGEESKSGGIATNIGVHFFDMLQYVFGAFKDSRTHISTPDTASGILELEHATITWFLSINAKYLESANSAKYHHSPAKKSTPNTASAESTTPMQATLPAESTPAKRTHRTIVLEDEAIEFSEGFENLHTKSYEAILQNEGFGLEDARASIQIVHHIRTSTPIGLKGEYHPLSAVAI